MVIVEIVRAYHVGITGTYDSLVMVMVLAVRSGCVLVLVVTTG